MKGSPVAVVVMGEIARSPRMINHARELAANGFAVVLIGYAGRGFQVPPGVRVVELNGGRSAPPGLAGLRFMIHAGLRMANLFLRLFLTLRREKPKVILLQNPPSFPTFSAASLAARCFGGGVAVDWHNYGFTLLALRLGPAHPFVRLARWYEFRAARSATAHFCVSVAMREDLLRRAGIRAVVLYDRPLTPLAPVGTGNPQTLTVVCPAGWTDDEDMELLANALESIGSHPSLRVLITGDGPKRRALEPRLATLRATGVLRDTGFVPEAEYWDLVRHADLGLSLHRSSSGFDLAMKVVDLFSAGTPVCALDYGGSIGEHIEEGVTGFLFRSPEDLAALLLRFAAEQDTLACLHENVGRRWSATWADEWREVALPVLSQFK